MEAGVSGHGRRCQVQSPSPWGPLLPGHLLSCAGKGCCHTGRDGSTASRLRLSLLSQEQDPMVSALSHYLWVCTGLP